jgi:hypothetical protein
MKQDDKQLTEITIKVRRMPAVVFGIIGVVTSTLLVFALVIYGSQILEHIIENVAEYQVLLTVATALAIAAAAFIILTIFIISAISIWGRFNKGLRVVLFAFLVLAIFLLVSAAAVGAVWLSLPR